MLVHDWVLPARARRALRGKNDSTASGKERGPDAEDPFPKSWPISSAGRSWCRTGRL